MEEIELFSRTFRTSSGTNTVQVKLTTESEYNMYGVVPVGIKVGEGFSFASPMVSMTFRDSIGVYFNITKIDPSDKFYLHIGDFVSNYIRIPLQLSRVSAENLTLAKSEDVLFTVHFISPHWNDFMNVKKNRGWNDIRVSDVINTIAKETGEIGEISDIGKTKDFIIQPYWSNFEMIKWLQKEVCSAHKDHFEFYFDLSGKFYFKSISDIIKEKIESKEIPKMRMDAASEAREQDYPDNYGVPDFFLQYRFNENYVSSVLNGSSGYRTMYYDFETGRPIINIVKFSDSDAYQLSDWGAIQEINESGTTLFYNGRRDDVEDKAFAKISDVSVSTNTLDIITEGTVMVKTGDIIEVIIPSPLADFPFNIIHSGFYVVAAVTHDIHLGERNEFVTTITLTRRGYDGKELEGYIKSKTGKRLISVSS